MNPPPPTPGPGRAVWIAAMIVAALFIVAAPFAHRMTDRFEAEERPADRAAIQSAWEAYLSALVDRDGDRAAALLTPAARASWAELADQARSLDQAQTRALPPHSRLVVLQLRHNLTTAELAELKGEDLFALAVYRGWVSRKIDVRSLEGIRFTSGTAARGMLDVRADAGVPFLLQDGQWRLDLVRDAQGQDRALAEAASAAGRSVDDHLLWLVEQTSGRAPGPGIWQARAGGE